MLFLPVQFCSRFSFNLFIIIASCLCKRVFVGLSSSMENSRTIRKDESDSETILNLVSLALLHHQKKHPNQSIIEYEFTIQSSFTTILFTSFRFIEIRDFLSIFSSHSPSILNLLLQFLLIRILEDDRRLRFISKEGIESNQTIKSFNQSRKIQR